MESVNPYTSPGALGSTPTTDRERSPWRFFIYSLFFYPVWFVVGGAFSISGSEEGLAMDVGLLVAVLGGSAVTFLMGVIGTIRRGSSR